jgi:hypothetical protein
MSFSARKAKHQTMNIFQKVTLSTILFAGAIGFASAQSSASALEVGLHSVAEFHGISVQEAVASESLRAEAWARSPSCEKPRKGGSGLPNPAWRAGHAFGAPSLAIDFPSCRRGVHLAANG